MHSLGLGRVCVQTAEACAGISCGVWMYSKGDETKVKAFKKEGAKVVLFSSRIFLVVPSSLTTHPLLFCTFSTAVKKNPKKLFVFVADEAHWGISKGALLSFFFNMTMLSRAQLLSSFSLPCRTFMQEMRTTKWSTTIARSLTSVASC